MTVEQSLVELRFILKDHRKKRISTNKAIASILLLLHRSRPQDPVPVSMDGYRIIADNKGLQYMVPLDGKNYTVTIGNSTLSTDEE